MTDAMPSVPVLSVKIEDAPRVTGQSRTRIYEAVRDGRITARKDGKQTLIEIDELRRYLRSLPTRGGPAPVAA